jgi:carboxyl-terminal processing protease
MIGLAFGVGYISYPLLHTAHDAAVAPAVAPGVEAEMDLYWEIWRLLDRDFYGGKPTAAQRSYGAIRGMVESFDDPYTYFVEPQPRALERDQLAGKFGGIGASIELGADGYHLVPQEGQPAALAGIQAGDLLLMVDDHEITAQMTVDDVVALVRGPVGSRVALVVRRQDDTGATQQLTLQVTRTEIYTSSVEWRMVGAAGQEAVGYISLSLFTERSPQEMQQAIAELAAQGAASYILDLRGNPGGLVNSAVQIADLWLDGGTIYIEQRADGGEQAPQATHGMAAGDAPLAVIVDAGSASASEIVAGAIQDHGRGKLVGEKTFGKGSVQLIHELSDRSSLHVTNAQWLTPDRHPITAYGLQPDVPVEPGTDPLPQAIALVEAAAVAQAGAAE